MADEQGTNADRQAAIKSALSKLDTTESKDWTQGGLPDLDRMKEITGFDDLKRVEISDAAPGFNKTNANAAPSDMSNVGASAAAVNAASLNSPGSADQHETEAAQSTMQSIEEDLTTSDAVAKKYPNPILLLEAATQAGQADEFRRNGPLQQILRHYMVDQKAIKDHQDRLDVRTQQRADAAKQAAS